tara:strand:- start:51 stop:497 length:447 start_codon:yes stop_codon:yes gene_type:complete
MNDKKWMAIAIEQAKRGLKLEEVPVGAVLVLNDKLVAKAHNQSIVNSDATAHAEIQLLRKAGKKLGNYRLTDSTLYVTLEPCTMCFGAMIHARIERLVYGAYDPKTGVCGSCGNLTNADYLKHKIDITGGILEKECSQILKSFFKLRR